MSPSRASRDSSPGRRLPEKFGRYLLIERVGSGGMAEVFRAMTFGWEGFRRVIVVKRIRRELGDTPEFLQMFFDEAKISALLHHPNIVQVYDFGQVDGAYFLAMEHIDGKDLGAVLRAVRGAGQALHPSLVALVGHEMAQGLSYAHTLVGADGRPFDIVHRDVNPSNVMMVRTGGVKLLDFGIAKASEAAGKTQTQKAMLKGKLSYLSPEQARCEPLDGRSDLFSWGSTIWELLTGTRLFGGRSDFDRLNAVKHAPVVPPSRRRPDVPPGLERIVLRALERNIQRRYQSAAELAADLEAYLRAAPPEPDAIPRLLGDLFGEESSRNLALLPEDLLSMDADAGDSAPIAPMREARSEPEQVPTLVDGLRGGAAVGADGDAGTDDGPATSARRMAALWAIAALVLAGAAAFGLWSLRARSSQPVVLSVAPAAPVATTPAMVSIDIDSDPPGAVVHGTDGTLGTTPLSARFPTARETETLRFEKPGFAPETYELRPRAAGAVFVKLRPAAR